MSKPNESVMEILQGLMGGITKQASPGDSVESGSTGPATEGTRSSENSSDVKKAVPNSVDASTQQDKVPGAGSDTPTNAMGGIKNTETGKDVPSTKSTKDDPGTSMGATAGGEKYASTNDLIEGVNDVAAQLAILTRSMTVTPVEKKAAETTKAKKSDAGSHAPAEQQVTKAAKEDNAGMTMEQKAAAFDKLAGYVSGQQVSDEILAEALGELDRAAGITKQAAAAQDDSEFQKLAAAEANRIISVADRQTSDLIDFVVGFQKAAEGEIDPALMAAIQAEGGQGGAPAPDQAGQVIPAEALGAGGPAAGEQIDPQALEQLVQELEASGVTPEMLEQALAQEGQGGAPEGAIPPVALEAASEPEPEAGAAAASNGSNAEGEEGSEGGEGDEGGEEKEEKEESEEEKSAQAKIEKLAAAIVAMMNKKAAAPAITPAQAPKAAKPAKPIQAPKTAVMNTPKPGKK